MNNLKEINLKSSPNLYLEISIELLGKFQAGKYYHFRFASGFIEDKFNFQMYDTPSQKFFTLSRSFYRTLDVWENLPRQKLLNVTSFKEIFPEANTLLSSPFDKFPEYSGIANGKVDIFIKDRKKFNFFLSKLIRLKPFSAKAKKKVKIRAHNFHSYESHVY